MQQRLDYIAAAPDGYKAFGGVHRYIAKSLDESLVNLVYLRVSQINGCAYCVDLHTRDAIKAGEDQRRLHNVITWREAPFFTDRERAALAWAESLTRLPDTGAPDADYEVVRAQFNDKELADLTYAIALMNAFNRLGVGFRRMPAKELS
jgi:AhpD family alkylhydroperoxidase